MPHRTFVTGFLAFGGISVNPSALLAASLGGPFELLEVSFAAVDAFLDRLDDSAPRFDLLLMLGLSAESGSIRFEQVARNYIGPTPDVRGVVRGPAPIEPGGPESLRTTLARPTASLSSVLPSDDAGCYLCNYIYYRALRRFPGRQVGFVHIPRIEVFPPDAQRREVSRLIDALRTA